MAAHSLVLFDGRLNRFEQGLPANRFAQELDRSALQRPLPRSLIGMGGDKDDRECRACSLFKMVLKLEAAHPGQMRRPGSDTPCHSSARKPGILPPKRKPPHRIEPISSGSSAPRGWTHRHPQSKCGAAVVPCYRARGTLRPEWFIWLNGKRIPGRIPSYIGSRRLLIFAAGRI